MQTAQRIISSYRRRRVIVCILLAALVFSLTLGIKYVSERQFNELRVLHFSQHAITTIEALLAPFDKVYQEAMPLVDTACENIQLILREHTARSPTIRSISLVKKGVLYCSSIFGATSLNIRSIQPLLPSAEPRLLLTVDHLINKGSPILLSWRPLPARPDDGIIQVINLEMIAELIQGTDSPWITRTILNVADAHFEYSHGMVMTVEFAEDLMHQNMASTNYPFSITTVGPSASSLALHSLVNQLPLAVVLSLLAALITWCMTAKRMSFSHEITMGLAAGEFEVYCQPLINACNQQCVGIELLLRWQNPRQGTISPDAFIPLAEQQHLIVPLTCFVLRETAAALELLPQQHDFHISINVAASHFKDNSIIDDLHRYWFPARPQQQLILELTERDALPEVSHHVVRDLHQLGVKLAIDDFGTGQSSLAYLETLSPDILKIDKIYTSAIGTDAVNSKVTEIIISLGHRLQIDLIAEGVETDDQAAFLQQQGVTLLQGYLYAKPMRLLQFPDWLESHNLTLSSQNTHTITDEQIRT